MEIIIKIRLFFILVQILWFPFLVHSEEVFTPSIDSPAAISEWSQIELNGRNHWVLIRSVDTNLPALLYLHGGPASSELVPMRMQQTALESNYLLVYWDQPGAGRAFYMATNTNRLNFENYIQDTSVLSEYIIKRFGKEKIYLVGHSWGTMLGMLTINRFPDLYHAYVGIAQIVDIISNDILSYQYVWNNAMESNNQHAIDTLQALGKPPYSAEQAPRKMKKLRDWLAYFGGAVYDRTTPSFDWDEAKEVVTEYTEEDFSNLESGFNVVLPELWDEFLSFDLRQSVTNVKVPVYFILGRYDYMVPTALAESYFKMLDAPEKELIWFEESGHQPIYEQPDLFLDTLNQNLLYHTN